MNWQHHASAPALGPNEVHVWRVSLDAPVSVPTAMGTLSRAERLRAERFATDQLRRRFVHARFALRTLLGQYLDIPPGEVPLQVRSTGKLYLGRRSGAETIEFNLAHTADLAVIAVTRGRFVGIDIERFRRDVAFDRLVDRFFADPEIAAFRAMPEVDRPVAFFRGWTRKEAYLKATDRDLARGLPAALSRFTISSRAKPGAAVIEVAGHPEESARWSLVDFDAGPAYPGALVVEGTPTCLFCHWVKPWE